MEVERRNVLFLFIFSKIVFVLFRPSEVLFVGCIFKFFNSTIYMENMVYSKNSKHFRSKEIERDYVRVAVVV